MYCEAKVKPRSPSRVYKTKEELGLFTIYGARDNQCYFPMPKTTPDEIMYALDWQNKNPLHPLSKESAESVAIVLQKRRASLQKE